MTIQQMLLGTGAASGLFDFTSFEFTQAGDGQREGRTKAQILAHSDYDTTTYTWLNDTNFFDVTTSDGVYPVGIQIFTIPKDGTYRIEARGGYGGSIGNHSTNVLTAYTGGIGARIQGDFDLTEGEKLEILVGNEGDDLFYDAGIGQGGASGGGGSFVIKKSSNGSYSNSDILIIAGGGGGAEYYSGRNSSSHGGNGRPSTADSTGVGNPAGGGGSSSVVDPYGSYGSAAPSGLSGNNASHTYGGEDGYGGGGGLGGGGGGFYGRGGWGYTSGSHAGFGYVSEIGEYNYMDRARGGQNDATSGSNLGYGGFGGGGGGYMNSGYGGGGGGFSGGGGGSYYNGLGGNGGGGGSYNSGSNKVETVFNQTNHPDTVTGYDSFVKITLL